MADLKQLKIMRDGDFDQKDPITELTRIMGLPPRSAPSADDFDDFGIDLEAELLGAFEADARPPLQAANAVVPMRGLSRVDTVREPDESAAPAVYPTRVPEPEPAPDASAHDELDAFDFADDAFSMSGEAVAAFEEPAPSDDAVAYAGEAEAAFEEPMPAPAHDPEMLSPRAFFPDTHFVEPAVAAEPESTEPEGIEPESYEPESYEPAAFEPAPYEAEHHEPVAAYEPAAYEPAQFASVPDDEARFVPEAFEAGSRADTPDASGAWAEPEPEPETPAEPDHFLAVEDEPMATVDAQPDDFADLDLSDLADEVSPVSEAPPLAAPAAPTGPIFDPFAELAAMAALSSDRASSMRSPGQPREAQPSVPFAAPVAEASPPPAPRPEPTRFYSRANIAAPSASAPREAPRPEAAAHAPVEAPTAPYEAPPLAIEQDVAIAPQPVVEAPVDAPADARLDAHADINRALDDMIGAYSAPAAKSSPVPAPAEDDRAGDPLAFDEAAFEAALEADGFDDLAFDADLDEQPALAAGMQAFEPEVEPQAKPVAEERPRFVSPAAVAAPAAAAVAASAMATPAAAAPWTAEPIDDLDRVLDDMLGEFGDLDGGPEDTSLDQALAADDWAMLERGPAAWSGDVEPEADASEPMPAHIADADFDDQPAPAARASAWEFDGPDLETVEVPEYGVEPADELDIPDLSFEDDLPVSTQPDELELQFASAFADLNDTPTQPSYGMAAAATAAVAATAAMRGQGAPRIDDYGQPAGYHAAEVGYRQATRVSHDELARDWQASQGYDAASEIADPNLGDWPQEEYDVAPLDDGKVASAFHGAADAPRQARPGSRRRGLLVAGLVAGVAVVGGIAAFAFTRGGGDGVPVLVRADTEPFKVRPETPGGVTVPNEDKAVYDRVAGAQNEEPPTQETLVSAREEPVALDVRDVTPISEGVADEEMLASPGAKAEDRVEAADDEFQVPADESPVVAPRRVRTMVVRADGTLVPREEAPEIAEAPAPTAPAELAQPLAAPIVGEAAPVAGETAAVETAEPAGTPASDEATAELTPGQEPPVRRVETTTITPESVAAAQRMPDRGPVAPTRPSEQPVDIVGNTTRAAPAQTQVAAAAPVAAAPVAAATSEWAMQIASQPSPEGAQASYADLARRHGAILGGRGVNIVKADIAGKGTFWRVRIPAANRAEAISLCERYKAAGGSCFVAR